MAELPRMTGRPTLDRAAEIRRDILSAAMREFSDRGFHGCSIAGIAARAEVSRRTIYNQFQAKEQILELLIENTSDRLRQRLEAVGTAGGSPEQVLFNMGMCFQEDALGRDGRAISRVLVVEAQSMPGVVRKGLAARETILRPIEAYLARLKDEGRLSIDDTMGAARQFMHLTTSSVDYLLGEEDHSIEEQRAWVAAGVRTFLHGIARPADD